MRAYYNEIDPAAAHILTWLIGDGVIADGDVDTRSIADVHPSDLAGYTQAHFFAGGGLWSVAARLAGWADDRPLWTGSCPCQPFSVAGKGAGENDPRHLWPHFFRLIRACRPSVVMGEQVAGSAGYRWFDGVQSDLAGEDYACRAVDIPACAVNAPHIRQRLYWVAVGNPARQSEGSLRGVPQGPKSEFARGSCSRDMADAAGGNAIAERIQRGGVDGFQPQGGCDRGDARNAERATPADACRRLPTTADDCRNMADANRQRQPQRSECDGDAEQPVQQASLGHNSGGRYSSFWSDAEWLTGADGKARRAQPGVCLLVDGFPQRVASLRVAGNAIVPQVAAEVIGALMDVL